jgi:sugar (pentulose or hexulose) kinase
MAQELFLGLDLGTGGVRACAIDADAKIAGIATTALPSPRQDGDAIDQEPTLWWDAVVETIGKLTVDRTAIQRISVDGTSGTLLLTDGDGRPLTPGLMYNDARAGAEAARIGGIAPAESGAHGRSSALAKLLHLLSQGGDQAGMRCTRRIGSPAGSPAASTAATRTTR